MRERPLCVELVDDELRICIGVGTLQFAAENPPDSGLFGDGAVVSILNADKWAKDIRYELRREEEDGTTPIDLLLDAAMRRAIENGSAAAAVSDPEDA